MAKSKDQEATYRIGAVSRLTGIPPETLRVWERRYGVVKPGRAEGRFRLYARDDLGRLALIKQLVDAGNAIGSVANLSLGQLQERLETYDGRALEPANQADQSCRVAIFGETLSVRLAKQTDEFNGLEIIAAVGDRHEFESVTQEQRPDIIILEYATVNQQTVTDINRLMQISGAKQAIVVYGFGQRDAVRYLDTSRLVALRAPVSNAELRRIALGMKGMAYLQNDKAFIATGPIPPRRYNKDTLGRIAAASTTVECECPHHLSDLIMSLGAFETYSAECESRNKEDAALHAHLHLTTAKARSMLEEALAILIEAERLQINVETDA